VDDVVVDEDDVTTEGETNGEGLTIITGFEDGSNNLAVVVFVIVVVVVVVDVDEEVVDVITTGGMEGRTT
jgi:hypothetical protein